MLEEKLWRILTSSSKFLARLRRECVRKFDPSRRNPHHLALAWPDRCIAFAIFGVAAAGSNARQRLGGGAGSLRGCGEDARPAGCRTFTSFVCFIRRTYSAPTNFLRLGDLGILDESLPPELNECLLNPPENFLTSRPLNGAGGEGNAVIKT
jgi:hypothetical protein